MKKEIREKIDSDIKELIKQIPENDNDGVIFLSGSKLNDNEGHLEAALIGAPNTIASIIIGSLTNHDEITNIILNSVLKYLSFEENKGVLDQFKQDINNL